LWNRIAYHLGPDLPVVGLADIWSKSYAPEPAYDLARRHLGRIRSRYGLVACLGNHDNVLPHSRSVVTQALEQAGVQVLWNRIAYPLGPDLPVVGLADFWSKSYDPDPVLAQLPPDRPRLVLSHNPDTAEPLAQWRVDLQLSGHTHGGQVVLPGLGPLVAVQRRLEETARHYGLWPWPRKCYVVRHLEWLAGLHAVGENQLYVNRGLGTYAPGRLGCPPEVTLIRLEAA